MMDDPCFRLLMGFVFVTIALVIALVIAPVFQGRIALFAALLFALIGVSLLSRGAEG